MIITEHAREEMAQDDISEDEVVQCLQHGKTIIRSVINGEPRYGKIFDLKEKTIVVIYTLRHNEERIITTYPLQRKKWQK